MIAVIAIVAVVVVGVVVFRSMAPAANTHTPEAASTVETAKAATLPPQENMMTYTLEDVTPHSKAED